MKSLLAQMQLMQQELTELRAAKHGVIGMYRAVEEGEEAAPDGLATFHQDGKN